MAKILYVITELDPGGAERTLFELARGVERSQFEPTVAALTGRGEVGRWLEREGVPVVYLGPDGSSRWLPTLRLRRLMRDLRPDIVHSFLFHGNLASRLAAAGLGVRAVIGSIRVTEANRPLRLWLDRVTQRLTTLQTCVCEGVREFAIDQAGLPPDKLVTICNGVDASRYEGVKGTLREELGLLPGDTMVTTVARLAEQKGLVYLVRAAGALRRQFYGVHFVIVGEGPGRKAVHDAAVDAQMTQALHLLGRRDDVASILASSDLFVLPSLWEGMPNVLLEAMASGLPVVATEVGGNPELVEDHHTGLLVPPGDEQALRIAIGNLLSDPAKARRMGQAGRQKVRREFTLDAMIRANEDLYRRLLA